MKYCISSYMGATFAEDCVSACMDGSACTGDCMIACMDVSDDNTSMSRNMCPYISTTGTGMHIVTSTDESKVNMFVRGRTDAYCNYGRYKPIWGIGTDTLGKARKGISYADALH